MIVEVREAVVAALTSFARAKAVIQLTFDAASAAEIVASVLHGHMPRRGRCLNGLEYFVHGIGYTVIMASGEPVHLDGSETGDVFSVYDIQAFLEASEAGSVPDVEDIRLVCRELQSEGALLEVGKHFSIVDEGRFATAE